MIHALAQSDTGFKLSLGPAADLLTLKLGTVRGGKGC